MIRSLLAFVALLTLSACLGEARPSGSPQGPLGLPGGPGSGPGTVYQPSCGSACDAAWVGARYSRLTHAQWENTVQDLLHLPAPSDLSRNFTGDINAGVFDTHAGGLKIAGTLWADYQLAAETLAAQVTANADRLAPLLPASLPERGDARVRQFIAVLGERAFRRPLTPAELDAHVTLFAQGTALTGVTDAFLAGARIVIQALLQSPFFLCRVEQSEQLVEGRIPLSGHEIASRLSYALWNTMPDDALFTAAQEGKLATAEDVLREAKRMLSSPRARAMASRFHYQLLDLDLVGSVVRNPARFPGISSAFGNHLAKEAELFIDDVVFTKRQGFSELLTQPSTFVNRELAGVYGLPGTFTDDFQPATLDLAQRGGLLTRVGFLAAYAHDGDSDPIRRGVFMNDRILCAPLPPPPDNVPPLPASTSGTTRQRVNAHTGPGTCGAGCHGTLINPVGFAFENYDGLGRYRTTDNNLPVDASAEYPLKDGSKLVYANALEFSQKVSVLPQAHDCYVKHWIEYFAGGETSSRDTHLMGRLSAASREGRSVQELVLEIVSSPAFLNRGAEATP
jgi:hypothetical protein